MRVIKKDIDIFMDQLQKGDEGAFRVLFDEFYTALCLFAERFLGERKRRRTWFRRLFEILGQAHGF